MNPYYQDESVTLWHGKCIDVLPSLPAGSVDCIVTSPPYFGLRDYGVEGQDGLEASPAEYVANLVAVFAEARRVLADEGVLWLNLGDSYSGSWGAQGVTGGMHARGVVGARAGAPSSSRTGSIKPGAPGPKNLMGMPWRVALALQDDGWTLRNDVIWHKPNAMPESVTDRLSTRHEHVFLFSKSRRYWFDLDPIREPLAYPEERPANSWARDTKEGAAPGRSTRQHRSERQGKAGGVNLRPTGRQHLTPDTYGGRNPGDVWTIPTVPFTGAHFAAFPPDLARRCILSGCKPGGTVLDPYSGSGTTGMMAQRHGRRYVGIDINAEYLDLSLRTRLRQCVLDLGEGA